MSEKGSQEDVQQLPAEDPVPVSAEQQAEPEQEDEKAAREEGDTAEAQTTGEGDEAEEATKPSSEEAKEGDDENKDGATPLKEDEGEITEQQAPSNEEEEEGRKDDQQQQQEEPEIVPAPPEKAKPSEGDAPQKEDEPANQDSEQPASKKRRGRGGGGALLGRRKKEPKDAKPKGASGGSKKGVELDILMLDQVRTRDNIERKVKAEDVVTAAHKEADVEEVDYFSLFFFDDHERITQKIFVDPNKTLKDILPKDKQKEAVLKYGVKYYVPDPVKQLKDDHSKYLYCLQLCQDIRDGWVLVDRETATRLTALMLQSTLENYNPEEHLPGYTAALEDFMLLPKAHRPVDYEEQLVVLHKSKFGYTRDQAEAEFLETAKTLRRYGEHLFSVMDEDRSTQLLVGNSCRGISVYDNETEQAHYNWQDIVKISYKKKRFRIRFRAEGAEEGSAVETRSFFTGPPPQAKKVWRNAVEQHTYFRLSEPERPTVLKTLFRRNTLNFHGNTWRQSQRIKRDKTDHKFARTYSENYAKRRKQNQKFVVGKQNPPQEKTWMVLDQPPKGRGRVDAGKSELQKVQVDFRVSDGLLDDQHHYLIHRDCTGSFEVLGSAAMAEEGERAYKLSLLDEESQQATVTVSLNIDPDSTDLGDLGDFTSPLFDSQRLPVAKMGDATVVTTTTVTQYEGKPLTSGAHSQQVTNGTARPEEPTNGIADEEVETERVEPAFDGTEEANQVNLFLDREHGLMAEVFMERENGIPDNAIVENGEGRGDMELEQDFGLPPEVEIVVS